MIKPAIVAVGYNRPDSMYRLLTSIANVRFPFEDITLIVSIDQSDKSDDVEAVAEGVPWNHGKKVIRRFSERQGLRKHVLQCGDLSNEYGAVIILEDDLVVSPSFYQYTLEAVNFYKDEPSLAGIALYSHRWNGYANLQFIPMRNEYDAYFGQYSITWGQCWTKKQWQEFKTWYSEHQDKLPDENKYMPKGILQWSKQSWGKYFVSYIVEMNLFYLIPYVSLTTNFTDVGQHNDHADSSHQVPLMEGLKTGYRFPQEAESIKYDVFFERIFNDQMIPGISGNNVCVNLNLTKLTTYGKEYLLTTTELPMEKMASYAMAMHPIDANVVHDISGNDIFLYKCGQTELDLNEDRLLEKRLNYEMYGYYWKSLFVEGQKRFCRALKRKFASCRKK